jgi:transcriptional regulator with XRE-family HTH domain
MTPRQFLGKELCRARVTAGFSSQQALADHLGFERTVIAKAESGDRVPSDPVLTAWAQTCHLDIDHYQRLADLARTPDSPVPAWFEDYLEAERAAQSLLIWSPIVIPGLLQTGAYARVLLLAQQTDTSDDAIDALVNVRLGRQAIFDRADPPDVSVVLDEAVPHRLIGTPAIMHDALVHMAELALRPYIVVQVVPSSKGANAGIGGAFDIASADGAPDMLRTDGVEDQTTENRPLIRKHKVAFNRVRGDALSRDASRDLLLEAAEQWKTT